MVPIYYVHIRHAFTTAVRPHTRYRVVGIVTDSPRTTRNVYTAAGIPGKTTLGFRCFSLEIGPFNIAFVRDHNT